MVGQGDLVIILVEHCCGFCKLLPFEGEERWVIFFTDEIFYLPERMVLEGILHELAHFLLQHDFPVAGKTKERIEQEADHLAWKLLSQS